MEDFRLTEWMAGTTLRTSTIARGSLIEVLAQMQQATIDRVIVMRENAVFSERKQRSF